MRRSAWKLPASAYEHELRRLVGTMLQNRITAERTRGNAENASLLDMLARALDTDAGINLRGVRVALALGWADARAGRRWWARASARGAIGRRLVVTDLERLRRLLESPGLAALRKRYEQGRDGASVTLGRSSASARAALCVILGRPMKPSASLRFDIGDIDAVLRNSGVETSLRDALELIDGTIDNLPPQREVRHRHGAICRRRFPTRALWPGWYDYVRWAS